MTLENWYKENRWLKKEATSPQEISGLMKKVERNLKQASNSDIDNDWRLSMAMAAVLQCGTIALRVSGYRLPVEPGHHDKTIESLKYTVGLNSKLIGKLQLFCRKRGVVMYDYSGTASDTEVTQLLKYAGQVREDTRRWLKDNYPEYLKPSK
jgi:hypothetical protein